MNDKPTPATPPAATPQVSASAAAVAQAHADALVRQEAAQKKATEAAISFKSVYESLGESGKNVISSVSNLGQTIVNTFKNGVTSIESTVGALGGLSKAYGMLSMTMGTGDIFKTLGKAGQGVGTLSENVNAMGIEWKALKAAMGSGLSGITDTMLLNASAGQKAEDSLVSLLSNSGQLNKIFDDNENLIGNMSAQVQIYAKTMSQVAMANNQTLASTLAYAEAFQKIPGVLEENVSVGNAASGSINSLSAAMKVASGSGQNMSEVILAMNTAYTELGNSQGEVNDKAAKGLKLFSTMSTLSKGLGLEFKETQGFLNGISDKFKLMGDNTEAAAKIMIRFTQSLRDTGLTSTQSIGIIQGMVEGISKLSTGTKAFISSQQGGPGGLQGSIQIDQLLRQGKSDEVMTMVQDTLRKQFGGKIYTQAEGAQSQEAASQFTRQKMMLNSGAFGNLTGGSDEKATRLLEALASGNFNQFKGSPKLGADALESVSRQGNSLQEQGNTILNKIAVNSELTQLGTQVIALKASRDYFGVSSTSAGMLSKHKENQDKLAMDSKSKDITKNNKTENIDEYFATAHKNLMSSLGEGAGVVYRAGVKMTSDIKEGISNAASIAKEIVDKTKEGVTIDGIRKNNPTIVDNSKHMKAGVERTANNNSRNNHLATTTTVRVVFVGDADKLFKATQEDPQTTTTSTNTGLSAGNAAGQIPGD